VPDAFASVIADLPAGQIDAVRAALAHSPPVVAAIILEPCADAPPDPAYLHAVVDLAHKRGTLVISDEIIAGFRWHEHGAMLGTCGVRPDLVCFGKAIANGAFPIAALVGSAELMQHSWPISGTANAHPVGLAAVRAVLDVYQCEQPLRALHQAGRALRHGLVGLAQTRNGQDTCLLVSGDDPRPVVRFFDGDPERNNLCMTLLCQELARRGILWHPAGAGNAMAGHGPHVAETLDAFAGALVVVAEALGTDHPETWLVGAPSQQVAVVRG
jgi:glutamate-1-semialdehyde 2,1-aminomutase